MAETVYEILVGDQMSERRVRPDHWTWMDDGDVEFRVITLPWARGRDRIFQIARLLPRLRKARVVVTTEYFMTWSVCVLFFLLRVKTPHAAIGLNISGKSIAPRNRLLRRLNNRAFKEVDLAVVASRPEARQFHEMYDLPLERFAFAHWSFDLPSSEGAAIQLPDRPFFCLIGRNNRDHATFCEAIRDLDADGIIVASAPSDFEVPPNVRFLANIPLADCIRIIQGSVANVILVNDASRGAGHITIVTAAHCARPQIISDVDTASDYFVAGEHALVVPLHDPAATREAMRRLLDDPARADEMGRASAEHAGRWLTHASRTERLAAILRSWWTTGAFDPVDPDWARARGVPESL